MTGQASLLRRLIVLAGAATAIIGGAATAAAAPVAPVAEVTQDGWWNQGPQVPAVDIGPLGAPLSGPPTLPVEPQDALLVGAAAGNHHKVAAVGMRLIPPSRSRVTRLVLTLQERGEGTINNGQAAVVACPITSAWVGVRNGDRSEQPAADCASAEAPGVRGPRGQWTFDLTELAGLWTRPGAALAPNGVLLQPAADPNGALDIATFQVAFGDTSTGAIRLDAELAPAAEAAGSADLAESTSDKVSSPAAEVGAGQPAAARSGPNPLLHGLRMPPARQRPTAAPTDAGAELGGRSANDVASAPLITGGLLVALAVVWLAIRPRRLRARRGRRLRLAGAGLALVGVVATLPPFQHVTARVAGVVTGAVSPLVPGVDELPALSLSSRVVATDGSELSMISDEEWREWVPLRAVPSHVRRAVLAAEDADFYRHGGVDPSSVSRAALSNLVARGTQGGSTISQQLAKLNYVGARRTIARKLNEVRFALALERSHEKDELLEHYLNQVYFGRGAHGIGAAAQAFFAKDVGALTPAEAATLAGMIRAPGEYDPWDRPEAARARRNTVLRLMLRHGWLTSGQLDVALADPMVLAGPGSGRATRAPHFGSYVLEEAAGIEALGPTPAARRAALRTGGFTIESTLEPRAHGAAVAAAHEVAGGTDDPVPAVAAVQPGDGAIRVLVGGVEPGVDFDAATQGGRDVGATFAPVLTVAASTNASVREVAAGFGIGPENFREACGSKIRPEPLVTPLEQAAMYATFASGGVHARPYSISRIRDAHGKVVYEHRRDAKRVVDRGLADQVTDSLRPGAVGGGWDASVGAFVAATRDAWFIGYGQRLAAAVWLGDPETYVPNAYPWGMVVQDGTGAHDLFHGFVSRMDQSSGHALPMELLPTVNTLATARADERSPSPNKSSIERRVLVALEGAGAETASAAVMVEDLGVVVDLNSATALPPSSTQKLYTAASALLALGPDHRLRTEVRRTGPVGGDGLLAGDLVLVAGGDPTLRARDVYRLAEAVAQSGVRRVSGSLVIDDTHHDRERIAPGWGQSFVPDESGPLSAFALDGNRWRCDPSYASDPVIANGELFRSALARAGVDVAGPVRLGSASGAVVATHRSQPVADVVRQMLKKSDDFTAELLLKEIGGAGSLASTLSGVETMDRMAAGFGVPPLGAVDGSGLSDLARTTAGQQVAWLVGMEGTPVFEQFRSSLPVACQDGTLRHRFCGSAGAGRVTAKTGTGHTSSALAGYATTLGGRRVWFSFLLSGVTSVVDARAAIDRAVLEVVESDAGR